MLFAGVWAGEQLLVVSGTEVIIGGDRTSPLENVHVTRGPRDCKAMEHESESQAR